MAPLQWDGGGVEEASHSSADESLNLRCSRFLIHCDEEAVLDARLYALGDRAFVHAAVDRLLGRWRWRRVGGWRGAIHANAQNSFSVYVGRLLDDLLDEVSLRGDGKVCFVSFVRR